MAFSVTKWGYAPDPREPDFNIWGWDFGQLPPWAWTLYTEGATSCYEPFNDGVVIKPTSDSPATTIWQDNGGLPGGIGARFTTFNTQTPSGWPVGWTIEFRLEILLFGSLEYHDTIKLLFPVCIEERGPFNMNVVTTPCGDIPNPMFLRPTIWNAAWI